MNKNTSMSFKSEEENKAMELKTAIQEGIDSGIAHNFDPKKHLESLKN